MCVCAWPMPVCLWLQHVSSDGLVQGLYTEVVYAQQMMRLLCVRPVADCVLWWPGFVLHIASVHANARACAANDNPGMCDLVPALQLCESAQANTRDHPHPALTLCSLLMPGLKWALN